MKSCSASPARLARAKTPNPKLDYTTVPAPELIRACVHEDAAAWQEFIRRFNRIIAITAYRAARRWGVDSQSVVDDLIQESYLKLCSDDARVLREFDSPHRDAIYSFLKVVAANVANDYFKRLHAGKRGGSHADVPIEEAERTGNAAGPASPAIMERAVLLSQVDACLYTVGPAQTQERDRRIFWLYYRQGLTAREIVELPSIDLSLKGVESTLHRLTQLVRFQLVETFRGGGGRLIEKSFGPPIRLQKRHRSQTASQ